MKARKLLPVLLSVTASAFVLSGCSDWNNDWTAEELQYAKNFEQTFGRIDPNQDWNLVAQIANSNNVVTRAAGNTTTPTGEFKITVLPESQAANITAETMKDYSKMLPESNLGGAPYAKTNLGRVTQNFSANTNKIVLYPVYWWTDATDEIGLYYYSNETGSVSVTGTDGNSYNIVRVPITTSHPEELEYSYEADPTWATFNNYNYEGNMPEGYKQTLANANKGFKITDGTEYNEHGQSGQIAAGLLMKAGTKSLGYTSDAGIPAGTDFDYCYSPSAYEIVSAIAEIYPEKYKVTSDDNYKRLVSAGGTTWESAITRLLQNQTPDQVDPLIDAAIAGTEVKGIIPTGFRSKGIVVDLPATMKIGFYIKNGSSIMYSEGKLNHKKTWSDHSEEIDACYIATYESAETDRNDKPIRYLAFEDWYNTGDYDLNDIVFRVYGIDESTIIDNDEISEEGLFVCEDLGAFDFDFNDVVLKAKWRRYYKKTYHETDGVVTSVEVAQEPSDDLTITAMAAGGANPSEVYFKTATNSTGEKLGEIHSMLNGSAPTIINAGPEYGGDGNSFTFEEAQFPATWNSTSYPNGYISQIFGEGYLYVIASTSNSVPDQDGSKSNHIAERLITSDSYKTSGVPQMMLLPMYYEWCQESQPIDEVYPNFTSWVSDVTKTDWITNGKVEENTTDRGVTPATYAQQTAPTGNNGGSENTDIICSVSTVESITLWGNTYNGQTITIPSDNVTAGDILKITSKNGNKDFGTEYGSSVYAQGNQTELTITEAMIGNSIYVTLYQNDDAITSAVIKKQ